MKSEHSNNKQIDESLNFKELNSVVLYVAALYLSVNLILALFFSSIETAVELECNTKLNRRIEYVFWGHAVGCWIFEDLQNSEK